jgi:PR domain zinc finger protein 5
MDNYNNIINNEYNSMVYNNEMQSQHPMTSIPREMQISQNSPMHQHQVSSQQSDIINLSYHQRDMQMPHPNLPEQMGLFPTIPPQNQQHNHAIQQSQQQQQQPPPLPAEDAEMQQQISQDVNIQYNMDNVNVNIDMQNDNANYTAESVKDSQGQSIAAEEDDKNTPTEQNDGIEPRVENEEVKDEKVEGEGENTEESEEKKKEPEVDPNQCRVCKATESLIDIFAIEEDMRICDIITKMCSGIRIHERDFLPHMICLTCLGRLRIAYQLMKDVIATDTELRGQLKRSRKARKPTDGFVIVDCNEFTDSDDDEQNDDDDYQVSNAEEEEDDDFESVDSDDSRKIKIPKKRGPKPKKNKVKKMKKELASTAKRLKRDIVFIEADDSAEEEKKREKCKECSKTFSSRQALRMHRQKAHSRPADETPFKCNVCGRGFKYSINLTSHMQIHKESYSCDECGRVFALKSEVKRHALNQHKCSLSYECNKCRRLYCSVKRYQKHREHCNDYNSSSSKKKPMKFKQEDSSFTGRDLFKTVAPTTTTYWSDSFSD